MSYCRFSSLNWGCDVYVYDGPGGITIQVAANRYVSDTPCPPIPPLPKADDPEFAEKVTVSMVIAHEAQQAWRDNDAKLVPIGLPYDGAEYHGLDRDEAGEVLANLMAAGYRMPHDLIENVMVPE